MKLRDWAQGKRRPGDWGRGGRNERGKGQGVPVG